MTIEKRFYYHCRTYKNKEISLIMRAILKYGKENFKIEQIDSANSQNELNKKEIQYIKELRHLNGYNIHDGGNKPPLATLSSTKKGTETRKKQCIRINLETGEEIVYRSPKDAASLLNACEAYIAQCCRYPNKLSYNGHRWCYFDVKNIKSFEEPKINTARHKIHHTETTKLKMSKKRSGIAVYHKSVIAIDKHNNIIKFPSIKAAAVALNVKRRSISNVLHGWNKTASGYKFALQEV